MKESSLTSLKSWRSFSGVPGVGGGKGARSSVEDDEEALSFFQKSGDNGFVLPSLPLLFDCIERSIVEEA